MGKKINSPTDVLALPVTWLHQVGPTRAAQLARLGITTLGELLTHYPRSYEVVGNRCNIATLREGRVQAIAGKVTGIRCSTSGHRSVVTVALQDGTGTALLVWFNQPYRRRAFRVGQEIMAVAKTAKYHGKWYLVCPYTEEIDAEQATGILNPIIPVYHLTAGIKQGWLRRLIKQTLERVGTDIAETMPMSILAQYNLTGRRQALWDIHFPVRDADLQAARYRLAFEELFNLQRGLLQMGKLRRAAKGIAHQPDGHLVRQVEAALPFSLTTAQREVLAAIKKDMEMTRPMWRLLQGDVGSGKTVVAAIALAKTVENGCQGALMAPTEILAEQHYQTLQEWLAPHGVKIALLHGGLTDKAKKQAIAHLATGQVHIAVGTHSLISDAVRFQRLGLVVTDEQHRFGVMQRVGLIAKGNMPHVLLMTATPIPRTLALTIYGDLDISCITGLPPGRQAVKTYIIGPQWRPRVYAFVRREIASGRQAYIICPLIEESDQINAAAATALYQELRRTYLQGVPCALLHGRLPSRQKEIVMAAFHRGEFKALVTTSVIEVGVNVPNATVVVIEGAERFGLAQLHQLRGRVGRGAHQSYCILVATSNTPAAWRRLKFMAQTQDGLVLAEKDLQLRGPGQFFGTSQHGLPELKLAATLEDVDLLTKTRDAAMTLAKQEPSAPGHPLFDRLFRD